MRKSRVKTIATFLCAENPHYVSDQEFREQAVPEMLKHTVDPLGWGEKKVDHALEVATAKVEADRLSDRIEEHVEEQVRRVPQNVP